jgi:hypothetical protein
MSQTLEATGHEFEADQATRHLMSRVGGGFN